MKLFKNRYVWILAILVSGYGYMASCVHDDELIGGSGPNIVRGTEKMNFPTDTKVTFDKSHSNVGWESAYLGTTAYLTGRFNTFGVTTMQFDESNAGGINFEGWVWLNSVNTGEPGRDQGCLAGNSTSTFGTTTAMTTETANVAIIKSKSVEFSKTDKGYIAKCDFTFHGVTKEITAKLDFIGKGERGSGTSFQYVYGFNLKFSILAKTDFLISSNNIADNVDITCNAIFRQSL